MVFLILAILSGTVISLILRWSEKHVENEKGMFLCNYIVCVLMSLVFSKSGESSGSTSVPGLIFALGLGSLCGVLYLVNFLLLKKSIRENGVMLSSTFMKLGVLVPSAMAILVYHEKPGVLQLTGFVLAILAILILQLDFSGKTELHRGSGLTLIILLLFGGFADSITNIYDKNGVPELKDYFILSTFLAAGLLCLLLVLREKKRLGLWEMLFGALVGVPNYFAARFLLLAVGKLPAIVVYPCCNVTTIILVSLGGIAFFQEKLTKKKLAGILLILVALVLLNLQG